MNTVNGIDRAPLPSRAPHLDRTSRSSTVRAVSTDELLRRQDWGKLQARLTTFAHGRIRKRSWPLAQDLAQTAITDLLTKPASWDPEREPLLKHLAKRVISLAANEWHRKRTAFEVLFERIGDDDAPDEATAEDGADDVLDKRRIAAQFRARLDDALAGDEDAAVVAQAMADGHETPQEIKDATRLPLERIREARRRVFYRAKAIAKEMGEELDEAEDALVEQGERAEREEVES
jgi:hypothetical protein